MRMCNFENWAIVEPRLALAALQFQDGGLTRFDILHRFSNTCVPQIPGVFQVLFA